MFVIAQTNSRATIGLRNDEHTLSGAAVALLSLEHRVPTYLLTYFNQATTDYTEAGTSRS